MHRAGEAVNLERGESLGLRQMWLRISWMNRDTMTRKRCIHGDLISLRNTGTDKSIFSNKNSRLSKKEGTCMYVVCKEHVELAIDKFVDEYEDAPDMVDLHEVEFSNWTNPVICCMNCNQKAQFLIV
jgi:CxxH/CxxC protein (TIGR04129 family)